MRGLFLILMICGAVAAYGMPAAEAADDTICISTSQTVHIRFASELKYVNLSDKAIVARIVDNSKDILAVKARSSFEAAGSISCLEANGKMHTFIVRYDDFPETLVIDTRSVENYSVGDISEIADYGKELFHLGCSGYGISIQCDNVLIKDDMLYIVLDIRNGSPLSYVISQPRFAVESRKRAKRELSYEKAVSPKCVYGIGTVGPDSEIKAVFGFDKISLIKGQVLKAYIYEQGGSRNFVLTFNVSDINRARKI